VARRDLVSVPPEGDAEHRGHQDGGRNAEEGDRVHGAYVEISAFGVMDSVCPALNCR
jgi:hypothetical protein